MRNCRRRAAIAITAAVFGAIALGNSGIAAADDSQGQDARPLALILAGQSNMVGYGSAAELGDRARLPDTVEYYVRSVATKPESQARFGPEVSLGRALAEAMPGRRIILVKYALGTTSLLNWAPDWEPQRAQITPHPTAGPLYAELLSVVEELQLRQRAEVAGIVWMQGERDARVPAAGAQYFENLATLIAAFRRDLGSAELPFFMGLVNPPPSAYPAREVVRDAQRRAARELPQVYLVETDDLGKLDDGLHYDTGGVLELGRRFAAAYLESRR